MCFVFAFPDRSQKYKCHKWFKFVKRAHEFQIDVLHHSPSHRSIIFPFSLMMKILLSRLLAILYTIPKHEPTPTRLSGAKQQHATEVIAKVLDQLARPNISINQQVSGCEVEGPLSGCLSYHVQDHCTYNGGTRTKTCSSITILIGMGISMDLEPPHDGISMVAGANVSGSATPKNEPLKQQVALNFLIFPSIHEWRWCRCEVENIIRLWNPAWRQFASDHGDNQRAI